ncbi:hypothetical protein [Phreatobacter cathodiphilus]|uniref:Uncharacterized protein n=1 Tax=Phreatobacter cathodiphilus TaxID=1868589 RepID=A0A2S0NG43_9HYPH|nr:hypothetical protein [Phreatobacter cathodiphilus]AVO47140.1 hypothetical protein C6569_19965 [Phreatobacter cathodiphilus]
MTMVHPAGSSQPPRWRRREEDRAGAGRRSAAGSFQEALSSLPVPPRPFRSDEERTIRARPAAAFVAQLLAERLAPVRRRRRGDREEVDARYHAADPDSQPTASGSLIRRDI